MSKPDATATPAQLRVAPAVPVSAALGPLPSGIDADWTQWITLNLLRQASEASMLHAMAQAGLPPDVAQQALHTVRNHPITQTALAEQSLHHKLLSVVDAVQSLHTAHPRYAQVERVTSITDNELFERFVCANRPCLLTDAAARWPALQRWSFDFFAKRFGSMQIQVQGDRNTDAQFEFNKVNLRRQVRLDDFIAYCRQNANDNNQYLTANNNLLRRPEMAGLTEDLGDLPLCDRARAHDMAHLWIGPGGTNTPLHHDENMLWHTQLVGAKRWRLWSPLEWSRMYNHHAVFSPIDVHAPDLQRYPRFAQATALEVVVRPGEAIYLPPGWWHQVSALEPSISVNQTNFSVRNTFDYASPNAAPL